MLVLRKVCGHQFMFKKIDRLISEIIPVETFERLPAV